MGWGASFVYVLVMFLLSIRHVGRGQVRGLSSFANKLLLIVVFELKRKYFVKFILL